MVCLAFVGWRLTHRQAAPVVATSPPAGTIVPLADSIWTQTREGDVERVRLERGELRIRVRKQATNERFFVDLPDGRIEVRGTEFDVRVEGPRTAAIIVNEGVVVFRARSQPEVVLAAGQSWPPPPAPKPSSTAAPAPLEAKPPRPTEQVAGAVPDTTADDYDAAVRAYRQHDYDGAAERFERFAAAHPHARQAEDAMFLHASALAFAGHDDAAAKIAERFLSEYPRSIHARDAEELIARAARKNGN
jgi:TolA-binding protein